MTQEQPKKVVVHRKRRVFDDFFAIDEVEVSFEGRDGRMVGPLRRLSFERGDSVAALVLKAGPRPTILLVRQFKYPVYEHDGGWITETPAGAIDRGESAEEAMRREMLEEVGYRAERLERIATFYPSAGGSSERVTLFYAEVSSADAVSGRGGGVASEAEVITTLEVDVEDFFEKLAAGEYIDPKIIIGGLWLKQRLASDPANRSRPSRTSP